MKSEMRVVVLFLGAALAGGCATGSGASLAAKQGKPAMNVGGPTLSEHMEMIRYLSARPVMRESAGAKAETADPRLAAVLRLDASSPTAENHLRVAHEYQRLGILDTAYTYTNRALLANPQFAEAHEVMARIWRDWGLPGVGMGPAYRAIYFDPASASAQNTLGMLLDALDQPAGARRAFARAVAFDAKAGWALNNLCFVELRLGRVLEARSHCEAALALDPKLVAARNNLALTFVASGDAKAAQLAFLAAGDPAGAAYNQGIVYMARREYTPAGDAFAEAIVARPAFTAAKTRAHDARMLAITTSHD
jgi:type IV pilus assembly protein PilF